MLNAPQRRAIIRDPLKLSDPWAPGREEHQRHIADVLRARCLGFPFAVSNRKAPADG